MSVEKGYMPPGAEEWKAPTEAADEGSGLEVEESGGLGMSTSEATDVSSDLETGSGIALPERSTGIKAKEGVDAEKINQTVEELKQEAKLKYQHVVEPTIKEIEELCAKFPDPESFLGDNGILKDVKELFAMNGHFRALDERHMAHLQEIKQKLGHSLKSDELIKAKKPDSKSTTLKQMVDSIYDTSLDFSNPGLWPSHSWDWKAEARRKLEEQ